MDATHIHGVEIQPLPSFSPEAMPSGDTADGYVLAMNPATGKLAFIRTHILNGPSSLGSNISLTGKQQNFLWGSVGGYGMRDGLVAYVPPGVYNLWGSLTIACPTNIEQVITVWQGINQSQVSGREGIYTENPIRVGGGVSTWTGASHMPFSIPFFAHQIQFNGAAGTACEVSVSVYPKVSGSGGAALGVITADETGDGYLQNHFSSSFVIQRVRGF